MALTRLDITGDGVTTVVDVTFALGYLSESYVYVYLASDEFTTQLDYTWLNASQIQLNTPVGNGIEYHVRRVVDRSNTVNDYQAGAILRERNLDDSFVQAIMILQEIADGYINPTGTLAINSDIDMTNHNINFVAEALLAHQAMPKSQADTLYYDVLGDTLKGIMNANGHAITGLPTAVNGTDAISYQQVVNLITRSDVEGVVPQVNPRQIGDGATVLFSTPAVAFQQASSFFVSLDGVSQRPLSDYTIDTSGNCVFVEAPELKVAIDITWFEPVILSTIMDVEIPHIFDTVALFKKSLIEFPDGKTIHLNDRNADFTKITGIGAANTFDIIASTELSQSIKLIADEEVSILHLGAVPDWDGVTGTDNTAVIVHAVTNYTKTIIPKGYSFAVGANGSCFFPGLANKLISGGGSLHKTGAKGIFSFFECTNITVEGIEFDGQIVADEAANGDIWTGDRGATDYAFAISFSRSSRCYAINNSVYDFAWDGIVAQGVVDTGGMTATQITTIEFKGNRLSRIRGSMLWVKSVSGFTITGNNGSNPTDFGQKANFIFAVEWCHSGVISENRGYWIGDNAVGVGQMLNNVVPAVNRDIVISSNIFKVTRYHAILVAQGDNIIITSNTITQAGRKDMPDTNSSVLTGAITVLGGLDGGADEPGNHRITIANNIIHEPYEFGIYCFDRTLTTNTKTTQLKIHNNTITSAGKLTLAARLASGGIRTQMIESCEIKDNTLNFIEGDGISVFGQADVKGNKVKLCSQTGIHFPDDTIFGESIIHDVIGMNKVELCTLAGIKLFGQDYAVISGNYLRGNGLGTPTTENGNGATNYAGIGVRGVSKAILSNNICIGNGSSGIAGYLNKTVNVSGCVLEDNGATFTSSNLRSGVYLEGDGTTSVQSIIRDCVGEAGSNQQQPVRILYNDNAAVVDCRFGVHPTGIVGAVSKFSVAIP